MPSSSPTRASLPRRSSGGVVVAPFVGSNNGFGHPQGEHDLRGGRGVRVSSATSVHQGREQRRKDCRGLAGPKNHGPLDEKEDDEAEDGAAADELADAHGALVEINVSALGELHALRCTLERRMVP